MSRLARVFEKTGDYAEAFRWLEKAASAGDTMGMIDLGAFYMAGLGVPRDFAKARELFGKAAANGNALAMNGLGWIFLGGRGVPQDYAKARDWLEKAAEKGNSEAMWLLGRLYLDGKGVPQDQAKGRDLIEKSHALVMDRLERAAAQDDATAMLKLGLAYQRGWRTRDYAKARDWYEKAAEKGNAPSEAGSRKRHQSFQRVTAGTEENTRIVLQIAGGVE